MRSFLNPNLGLKAAQSATPVTGTGLLTRLGTLFAFLLLTLNAKSAAASGSLYYDLAGGVSKFQQTSPFFGNTTQSSTGFGFALNNGIFVNWGGDKRAFAFQLGLQHRMSSASDAAASYAVQAAYPVMRFQFTRFYVGTGFTPFVWKRSNALGGVDNFSSAKGTSALLAEAGLLMPVTPKFSLGTQASAQFMTSGGTKSPNPILDATVSMRFYFGFFGSGGGDSQSSGEFKGWRYPFGMIR
jgi:hypothetical protein